MRPRRAPLTTTKKNRYDTTKETKGEISGPYPQFHLNTSYNPLAYNGDKNNKYGPAPPTGTMAMRLCFNIFVLG